MIHLGDQSDHWCPIWEIDSKFEYERNNESNDDPTPLQRSDQDRVPPDEDEKLSQLLGLARSEDQEDQEDGVG